MYIGLLEVSLHSYCGSTPSLQTEETPQAFAILNAAIWHSTGERILIRQLVLTALCKQSHSRDADEGGSPLSAILIPASLIPTSLTDATSLARVCFQQTHFNIDHLFKNLETAAPNTAWTGNHVALQAFLSVNRGEVTFCPSSSFLSTSTVMGLAEGGGSSNFWYLRNSRNRQKVVSRRTFTSFQLFWSQDFTWGKLPQASLEKLGLCVDMHKHSRLLPFSYTKEL